jgi:hypothetical protein
MRSLEDNIKMNLTESNNEVGGIASGPFQVVGFET